MVPTDSQFFQKFLSKCLRCPRFFAFLLGGSNVFAFAPFHLYPIFFLSIFLFLCGLNDKKNKISSFQFSFFFFYGFYLMGTYWLGNALKVYHLEYLIPGVWLLLPSVLALLPAAGTWAMMKLPLSSFWQAFFFSAMWMSCDYIKGYYILGGFPWNLVGYIWGLSVLQLTAYIGIFGLSFLTLLGAASLASRSPGLMMSQIFLFTLSFLMGEWTLKNTPSEETPIKLRIVQASIPQQQKWLTSHFYENLNRHLSLSQMESPVPLDLIIWPEASLAAFLGEIPELSAVLGSCISPQGYILVGGPRRHTRGGGDIFTSMFAVSSQGKIVESYDKSRLVPFGEYMPFKEWLPLHKLTPGEQDYRAGDGLKVIHLKNIPPFTSLICFEAIFPGLVVPKGASKTQQRPQWLLNQTNDAWFGHSIGPYQHLQIVRTRAIEEGLPLVRSSNNGISAVFDNCGRLLQSLALDEVGSIDGPLPAASANPTLFSRVGHFPFFIGVALSFVFSIFASLKRRKII